MKQWLPEHRAFVVETFFKSGDFCVCVQWYFRRRFNVGPRGRVPTRSAILLWVSNFKAAGSTIRRKSTTPENMDRVREAVETSPLRPARNQAAALHISDRLGRRILRFHLHFHPYKMAIVQKLNPNFYEHLSSKQLHNKQQNPHTVRIESGHKPRNRQLVSCTIR